MDESRNKCSWVKPGRINKKIDILYYSKELDTCSD